MTAPGTLAPRHLQWRYSALDLRPLPGAVPSARLHTRLVLLEHGHGAIAETAELIVSELVTNAIAAASAIADAETGPRPVQLRLLGGDRVVKIEVWDASDALPPRGQDVGTEPESGRGLFLVDMLSDRWGAYPTRGGGKIVWSLVTR
jgi:anti-sigma regulatory factor (Ser/Thr protein kinase)